MGRLLGHDVVRGMVQPSKPGGVYYPWVRISVGRNKLTVDEPATPRDCFRFFSSSSFCCCLCLKSYSCMRCRRSLMDVAHGEERNRKRNRIGRGRGEDESREWWISSKYTLRKNEKRVRLTTMTQTWSRRFFQKEQDKRTVRKKRVFLSLSSLLSRSIYIYCPACFHYSI